MWKPWRRSDSVDDETYYARVFENFVEVMEEIREKIPEVSEIYGKFENLKIPEGTPWETIVKSGVATEDEITLYLQVDQAFRFAKWCLTEMIDKFFKQNKHIKGQFEADVGSMAAKTIDVKCLVCEELVQVQPDWADPNSTIMMSVDWAFAHKEHCFVKSHRRKKK